MKAIVTAGNGGYDKLQYRVVSLPTLEPGEVLLQVLAAGVNNTEINTRIGWYSSSVTTGTEEAATSEEEQATAKADGGWNETTPFPFIQGTDCCGRIVAVASDGDKSTIGSRVLVRACMRQFGFESMDNIWMGSDFDGAFAQFVKVPAGEVFAVDCDWSDAELGTIPCAYGTAENMVHRGKVSQGERCSGSWRVRRCRLSRSAAGEAAGRYRDGDCGKGKNGTGSFHWSGSRYRS